MPSLKCSLVLMVLLVLASQFLVFETFADPSEDAATSALTDAEGIMASAYQAVLKAEDAGANVSGLLVRLNEAGGFLAHAHIAHRLGDLAEAVHSANLCSGIGESVKNDADELWARNYGSRLVNSWLTMTGSMLGVLAVGFGSFWSWRRFKRRYFRSILRMKPEVSPDGS